MFKSLPAIQKRGCGYPQCQGNGKYWAGLYERKIWVGTILQGLWYCSNHHAISHARNEEEDLSGPENETMDKEWIDAAKEVENEDFPSVESFSDMV